MKKGPLTMSNTPAKDPKNNSRKCNSDSKSISETQWLNRS